MFQVAAVSGEAVEHGLDLLLALNVRLEKEAVADNVKEV